MIDSHMHVWQIGRNGCVWPTPRDIGLYRNYGLDDYALAAAPLGIEAAVLVQSQADHRDTDWLLNTADASTVVRAVVGWADLLSPDAPRRLAALARRPKLVGIRPMVQDLAPNWFDNPRLAEAFDAMRRHGLVLDALVRPAHMPALFRLARRASDLAIVIDHAGKPDLHGGTLEEWEGDLARLGDCPNVCCKLSGLLTQTAPEVVEADLDAPIRAILAAFGAERTVWGSDWPVLTARADVAGWLAIARARVSAELHHDIFGANAARLYGLSLG